MGQIKFLKLTSEFKIIQTCSEENFCGIYMIRISNLVQSGMMKFHQMIYRRFPLTVVRITYSKSKECSLIFVEGRKGINGAVEHINNLVWKTKPLKARIFTVSRHKDIHRRLANTQMKSELNKFKDLQEKNLTKYPTLQNKKFENRMVDKYIKINRMLSSIETGTLPIDSNFQLITNAKENQCKFSGIMTSPKTKGYQNKCKFDIERQQNGQYSLNFSFDNGLDENNGDSNSRKVTNTKNIIPQTIQDISTCFTTFLSDHDFNAFSCINNSEKILQLIVRISAATDDIMIIINVNRANFRTNDEKQFQNELIKFFESVSSTNYFNISLYYKHLKDDLIQHLFGPKHIIDVLGTIPFRIGPLSSFPNNTVANELLYKEVLKMLLLSSSRVIIHISDGNANLSLCLASKCAYIVAFDKNIESIEEAQRNKDENDIKNLEILEDRPLPFIEYMNSRRNELSANLIVIIDQTLLPIDMDTLQSIRQSACIDRIIYIVRDSHFGSKDLINFCQPESDEISGKAFNSKLAVAVDVFPDACEADVIILLER